MESPCIYTITNILNGKIYIGSTKTPSKRFSNHINKLKNGNHSNEHLQNAWIKYKSSSFIFGVLEVVENVEVLIEREQYYLNTLLLASENNDNFYKLGYNKVRIAGSNTGHKFTDKGRDNCRKSHIGKLPSDNTRNKMRESHLGDKNHFYKRTHSNESKIKMSNSQKLIKKSDEFKSKISESRIIPVLQFSINGLLIKKWNSIKEAQNELKISHISEVCCKKRKTSGGYYWEYVKKENPIF